ncbi:MAG TPA: response regulator, partial [Desulfobacteraceae bacterium]|nr:response regulator [Desulfobacteraceae bacterium]
VPILTKAAFNAQSDYLVHLLTTLGYIGDQAALPGILDIVNVNPKDPNIRQAAYEALERLPSTKSAITLAGGLQDPVEAVRMSAARAVDKNLSKVLVAGLKNIVRQENKDAENTVAALIDSESDMVFNFLLQEESFDRLASAHVASKASPDTRNHFLALLKAKGHQELAGRISQATANRDSDIPENRDDIYAVDDSRMMLKLYQNKLGKAGYRTTPFQFPEEVMAAVSVSKPALVITDLNMPRMNGLQLTREIRRKYTRQELPILMITTQSDFVQAEDGNGTAAFDEAAMKKNGISRILHKPFTDEALYASVAELLSHQGEK